MAGVVGRRIRAAFGLSNTWAVPASVTRQLLIETSEGFDNMPELVSDESFAQDFIGLGEIGDHQALTPSLQTQYRFEQGPDVFTAAAMGSAANPTVVSSQAATSLVAYSHVITMSPELTKFFTLASNFQNYVQEIQTFKVSGFQLSVGDQGRINVSFPIAANKTVYDSTVNTSATIGDAIPATPGNRAFRRLTRLRMNAMGAAGLGAGDEVNIAKEFNLDYTRPLALDHVLNSDGIIEADDDGFIEGSLKIVYARMTSVSANSMQVALQTGNAFKADILMNGTYINSHTRRSALWELPALQVNTGGFKAVVVGHGQVRPEVTFTFRAAPSAPTGMSTTGPLRVTIINSRDTNLLSA
jgi:hypothetical protein